MVGFLWHDFEKLGYDTVAVVDCCLVRSGGGVIHRETAGFAAGTGCRADECVLCSYFYAVFQMVLHQLASSVSFMLQRDL